MSSSVTDTIHKERKSSRFHIRETFRRYLPTPSTSGPSNAGESGVESGDKSNEGAKKIEKRDGDEDEDEEEDEEDDDGDDDDGGESEGDANEVEDDDPQRPQFEGGRARGKPTMPVKGSGGQVKRPSRPSKGVDGAEES